MLRNILIDGENPKLIEILMTNLIEGKEWDHQE